MNSPKPMTIAAIAAGIALLLIAAVLLLRGGDNPDRLSDEESEAAAVESPAERCSSQRTYDSIKRELFRQAARMRGSDQAAFDAISAHASVRMERPVVRAHDDGLGTLGCSGLLQLDLPPGVAVVGGRRSLSAEINYVIQTAADGNGEVVMLDGADAIVVPLATLARIAEAAPAEDLQPPVDGAEQLDELAPLPENPGQAPEPAEPPAPPEPQPAPSVTANPSFDCGAARSRSEIAVCRSESLAALDRRMASQFNQAVSEAGPRQRALLLRTRDSFLRFRDQCPNDSCIAETYRGRMREIRDIMAGEWQPRR